MKELNQVKMSDGELIDEKPENPIDFDTILNEIGEWGRYQILSSISAGIISAYGSFLILNFVFGAVIPDHRYGNSLATPPAIHQFVELNFIE